MPSAFRVVVKTFKDIWGEMFSLVLMNLFTLLCVVAPLAIIFLASQLLGAPPSLPVVAAALVISAISPFGSAAWVALYHVGNRIANDYAVSWDFYFAAFRQHLKKSWVFGIFALFVTAAIPINIVWYPQAFGDQTWVSWVQGAWLALGLFWLAISFYVTAFYAEQEKKSWRVALRNAAVIAAANPIFTLTLLVIVGIVMTLSLLLTPVFILLGLSVWVMFGSEAVVNRVNAFRERMKTEAEAKPANNTSSTETAQEGV